MCPHATSQSQRITVRWVGLCALLVAGLSCQRPESPPQPILGSAVPTQSQVVATLTRPTAAALSSDGTLLFALAQDDAEAYQLFAGSVGSTLSVVPTSVPLSYPVALAIRRTRPELVVVDLGASDAAHPAGTVYRGTFDGTLAPLSSSLPWYPTAVALAADDRSVYVTGRDAQSGEAGVFQVSLSDGAIHTLFQGAPLSQPIAVAQTSDGGLYVAEAQNAGTQRGAIFRISAGQALPIRREPLPSLFPSGLCAAGRPSADLLFSASLATGTEPWLYRLSPTGTTEALVFSSATEVTALSRAADADLWVAIDAVVPADAASPDPLSLERPQGHVLLLAP
ncbi:MAG: hypothetical protein JNJ46_11410 [Myxococcales bacterium]|nr:hypothetical protein [Myxococcales bacterium]